MVTDKNREDRVRRQLAKCGYRLLKTPAHSWMRKVYGVDYLIVVDRTNGVNAGWEGREFTATLEEAEAFAFNSTKLSRAA